MHNIAFNLPSLHLYGSAFFEYLGLRKNFFVDCLKWDVPHDMSLEMDQYDNPTAHYSLVLFKGKVVAGARATPTNAVWGDHTYMLRDAMRGKIDGIPRSAMPDDICSPSTWECTRLVIDDAMSSAPARRTCLSLIVNGLAEQAHLHGASRLISLSPITLMRSLRQLGFAAERIGAPYASEEDGRRYAVLAMPTHRKVMPEIAQAA